MFTCSVRSISQWRRKFSSVCASISVFVWGKTGAETYKMLQAAFGESCVSRSRHLSGIPVSKVDANPLRTTPAQSGRPPPTLRRPWHMCEKSFMLTDVYQRGCRGCWNSIRYVPENSNRGIANETCVSEICAPSPEGRAQGRSHVSLH